MKSHAIALLAACGSPTDSPAPTPALMHDAAVVADKPVRPRGPEEIDGFGVGPIELGTPASTLASRFTIKEQQGSASFTQNGKPVPTTVRFGSTATLQKDGIDEIVVGIEPSRMVVSTISVVGKRARTREGLGVGSSRAEVTAAYGAPEARAGDTACEHYATLPGVDLCFDGDRVNGVEIPASYPGPRALGEDLGKIRAAIDGRVLLGRVLHGDQLGAAPIELIAPCVISVHEAAGTRYASVVARGGAVYQMRGGWLRPNGYTICDGPDVFAVDGARAVRWRYAFSRGGWIAEPALCKRTDRLIQCAGVVGRSVDYHGVIEGELIRPDRDQPLAEQRAIDPNKPADDCERFVAHAWTAAIPARVFVGAPTDGAARIAYLDADSTHGWVARCVAKPEPARRCRLSGGSLQPIEKCALDPPLFDLTVFRSVPRPDLAIAEQRARARAMIGTWWRPDGLQWQFAANGQMSINGEPRGTYSLPRAGELVLEAPHAQTKFEIARIDTKHFYAYSSRISCPVDPTHAEIELGAGHLVIRGDECNIVSTHGALIPASCTRTGTELVVGYRDPAPVTLRLIAVDGCYVDSATEAFAVVSPR